MIADRNTDLWIGACLCMLGLAYLYIRGAFASLPFEDAAILMRYVDHLAQGEGIVWNRGEAPIDGATDFLFVLCAAALQSLGFSTEIAVQILNVSAYVGTIFLVFFSARKQGISLGLSMGAASIVLLGPAYAYIEAYFATTFFAFWACLLAYWGLECIRNPESSRLSWAFGITALILGLSRPEGVFLSLFIMGALVFYLGKKSSVKIFKHYVICLVGIGSLYLIWRFIYFGHLLPNPFYKKGGGLLYPASFLQSGIYILRLLFPLVLLGVINAGIFRMKKELVYVAIPVLAFTSIWIFLSNEMNYMMRFQYVLLPISVLNLGFLGNRISLLQLKSRVKSSVWMLVSGLCLVYYLLAFQADSIQRDGRYEVALILQEYQEKGYKMACTEAGLLPFYARWNTMDTWGLNDHKIATEGVISRAYLDQFSPDLIMYDAFVEEGESLRGSIWDNYGDMVDTLNRYIQQKEYTLVARFPDKRGRHAHSYYLKNGLPDADSLTYKIRNCTYYWYEDGSLSLPEFYSNIP